MGTLSGGTRSPKDVEPFLGGASGTSDGSGWSPTIRARHNRLLWLWQLPWGIVEQRPSSRLSDLRDRY